MKVLVESKRQDREYGTNDFCSAPYSYSICGMKYTCPPYTAVCDGSRVEPWNLPKGKK